MKNMLNTKIYQTGYLSGVFDLFHVGHLEYLLNAKSYCEKLIVGVNDDAIVWEYKKRKPVIPCQDRMKIVSALKCVDDVIKVSIRDEVNAHSKIHFDVLFMSEAWKEDYFYKDIEEKMANMGADVIWLPYKKGISTSIIRKKIKAIEFN